MGRLTYLKNGRPCLLINGSEYFGPVAERLHALLDGMLDQLDQN